MSESREERQQRRVKQFRDDEAYWNKARTRLHSLCNHLDERQNPAIGLQHNFPDRQVRGICLKCGLVIHPRHWEFLTPNGRATLVDAHPFYPVVLAVDVADVGRAILNDVEAAAVDSLTASSETQLIAALEQDIYQARWALQEDLRMEAAMLWPTTKETK